MGFCYESWFLLPQIEVGIWSSYFILKESFYIFKVEINKFKSITSF